MTAEPSVRATRSPSETKRACPFLDCARADRLRARVRSLLAKHESSVLGSIGRTGFVRLSNRINSNGPVDVWAKLENQNPSGSVKDRIALHLIADALERGFSPEETVLVEASSGNTGISVAMVAAVLGIRVVITVPDNVGQERFALIRSYGAEVMFTPGAKGTAGAIERARELSEAPGYYWIAQHYNTVNSFAHYETTGAEIAEDVRRTGVRELDAFVASSGTTGTLMGVSARLKTEFPRARIVAVWPKDAILGIRRPEGDNRPAIYDDTHVDDVIDVRLQEATDMAALVARTEGLFVGPSGGAAIVGALRIAERTRSFGNHGTVVVLIPDSGERYLSLKRT